MASFFFIDDHSTRAGRRAAPPISGANGVAPTGDVLPLTSRRASLSHLKMARRRAPAPELQPSPSSDWAQTSTLRREVRPPALFAQSQPAWRRWMLTAWNWLWDDEDLEDHPRVLQSLNQVKTEFLATVWDLQSYNAAHARENITQARSLRELWHLRADVFRVIAVHRGQAEAQRRLDTLNRHFPVRVSTSAGGGPASASTRW